MVWKMNMKDDTKYPRLPCRGCLKSCINYHRCEGNPGRVLYQISDKSSGKEALKKNRPV